MVLKEVAGLAVAAALTTAIDAQNVYKPILSSSSSCRNYVTPPNATSEAYIREDVKLWQSIVLLLCFGAFALFICLIHRLIRTYIYYDSHLLDTFFDGGGDVNVGLIATSIVAKWAWPYVMTQSSNDVRDFGLVGHFWFAAGMCIQLFLFAIVVAEIRIKAPGAKTFLQVIKARFGAPAHITMMIFAFAILILVSGIVMTEGGRLLVALSEELSDELVIVIIAVVVAVFTVVGGVGGHIYVAYFASAIMITVAVVFFADVFYDPLGRDEQKLGDVSEIFKLASCVDAGPDNENNSALTFLSKNGMMKGILYILTTFGLIFVDQSFWQSGVAAKPSHSVWGFITGGLSWFGLAFVSSYGIGMAYLGFSVRDGRHMVTNTQAEDGLIGIAVGQRVLEETSSYLMYVVVMVAVITTASAEVLAASSIIVYDIYQTYIAPFRPTPVPDNKQISIRMQRAIRNEEYLEYDRRCVVLKHVVVVSVSFLLIPIGLIVTAVEVDTYWLYIFTSILVSSCVLPIALAITWHRITGAGVVTGCIGGFGVAVIAWLVVASSYEGGIEDFRNNTVQDDAVIVGAACALGLGGILCIMVSLCCGGCDADLQEEEEWEKVRHIDSPILPWAVKYAPNIGPQNMTKGRPHFYTVRRTFKASEICAYIFGVLLAVCMVLVWPALMLTVEVFDEDEFEVWTFMVAIVGAVILCFLLIIPLLWEIITTCRQAYYNRMWSRSDNRQRLEEETPTPEPSIKDHPGRSTPPPDNQSQSSTIDRSTGTGERWKTFIALD